VPPELKENAPLSYPAPTRSRPEEEAVLTGREPLASDTLVNAAAPTLVPVEGGVPVSGFQLVRCLGKGGFGEVWQATGPGGFAIALKFIRMDAASSDVEVRSLEVMKKIRHPNLLGQFGAWEREGMLIIGMELADGNLQGRLAEAVAEGLPGVPAGELLGYMADAARGIDYLNEPRPADGQPAGVQHRDIKPGNLLLVGGCVKVGDFGLAKLLNHPAQNTSNNMTVSYAAPECLDGSASPRSDQYSLAVSYCQLRGNRLPFRGDPLKIMAGHLMAAPDLGMLPPAERPPVERALAKKPEDRWPSCRAFVEALAAAVGEAPGPVPRPAKSPRKTTRESALVLQAMTRPTPRPRPRKLSRRERKERETMRVVGLLFLTLVTSVLALLIFQSPGAREFLADLVLPRGEKSPPPSRSDAD
jgi:serine/threonine protein kinase